ncbi:NAD(P)-dependent oxidoreductase [Pseudomonas sp. Choline-3u-10]|jgi:predicted homoserine dehydrogenase-like protein|uniref:NAD(P)-dependent oxidoreductase n=1 Tax=Pseudomonadaceae TaxID=135621 RepID=UPI000C332F91|nr:MULTISPECIES: NAD(P)-dependent oxidoreductase [Pseudomonadaceae]MAL38196.1 NAD(P)-dependent oxidoreductase [Pseudomonas sp.]MBU0947533.1 NAD(P)-dependent oxidoreductase [Gammaproteobacteria bacterium]MBK3795428.1 NAD(P)-dependent oxidoreductase [Stutzerimonas stutzeri]MBK3878217.1 NAD(P)-dependent oxidoreductase [Stutzerimonas stutzeri]PKG92276.1 NAD(P)-dependent oxidoreductase [Pseudomonas sp. Choline-3u-10]|tara:strand:- start:810 stop:1973 length:1164 start_codon:yes stop_codon:yes gene_type:complete
MISHCFVRLIMQHYKDLRISRVLTRRSVATLSSFPLADALTNSIDDLIANSDVIVECTGDVFFGTEVIERAFEAGVPVVTINAELQVTTGSYLCGKGFLTEAEGDQPGSLAALREEALQMGFQPLVYGNMKGYLNHNPSPEDMAYWSKRQGISIEQTTSFTDGTKVQIEQVVVGNGFGATITRRGLEGLASTDLNVSGNVLGLIADGVGQPIVDYVLPNGYSAGGVFLVCRHDEMQAPAIEYFKLGPGPYYVLTRPFHLCSLEVGKTVRRVLAGGGVLLNNSVSPTLGVAAIAKREMKAGEMIGRGIGGFDVRGEAVKLADELDHVPIGLLRNTVLKRAVEPGQLITFDDIEVQPSRVLDIIFQQQQKVLQRIETDVQPTLLRQALQ